MREIVNNTRQDRRIVVYLVSIIVCVFLGPFGTATQLEFWDRLIFWTVSISAVGFFMEICMIAALRTPHLKSLHVLLRLVLGAAIGGIPGTAVIIFVNLVFRPEHLESSAFPDLWWKVSVMALIIAAVDFASSSKDLRKRFVSGDIEAVPETHATITDEITPLAPPPLVGRLDASLRLSEVISLSMQDHYVEVTTTEGAEMILMRLVDAIELLDGLPGVRTHRSHWAAKAHSTSVKRVGRRHFLILSDGRELPVSKSYVSDVEAMLNEKGQA